MPACSPIENKVYLLFSCVLIVINVVINVTLYCHYIYFYSYSAVLEFKYNLYASQTYRYQVVLRKWLVINKWACAKRFISVCEPPKNPRTCLKLVWPAPNQPPVTMNESRRSTTFPHARAYQNMGLLKSREPISQLSSAQKGPYGIHLFKVSQFLPGMTLVTHKILHFRSYNVTCDCAQVFQQSLLRTRFRNMKSRPSSRRRKNIKKTRKVGQSSFSSHSVRPENKLKINKSSMFSHLHSCVPFLWQTYDIFLHKQWHRA